MLIDSERDIEYHFWWYRLHDRRPALTLSYSNPEGFDAPDLFLSYMPTAMCFVGEDKTRLLVAGRHPDGHALLLEYRFQIMPDFKILMNGKPFADVSSLSSIADMSCVDGMTPVTIQVLDGRSGQFGMVREGGAFHPQVGEEHTEALRGKLSIWHPTQEVDSPWPLLSLWPLPPTTCANPEKGAALVLDPPEDGGTQYSKEVRFR